MVKCLAILRELTNSPNRESDDALILKATMEHLRIQRVSATIMTPEQADGEDFLGWDMIVPMCESYSRLRRLDAWERVGRAVIVNRPASVLACYRARMLAAFRERPGVLMPETELRPTQGAATPDEPAFDMSRGAWVKRGDVHNTCSHDVVFARDMKDVDAIRQDFQRREIPTMLIQRHIDGDLVKFYGVGPGQWFTWFYHDPHSARRLPFELEDLAAQAETGAAALGLEIYGGDAIVSQGGPIYLIDVNSWPSFARVRDEASVQIARRLRARLRQLEPGRPRGKT